LITNGKKRIKGEASWVLVETMEDWTSFVQLPGERTCGKAREGQGGATDLQIVEGGAVGGGKKRARTREKKGGNIKQASLDQSQRETGEGGVRDTL